MNLALALQLGAVGASNTGAGANPSYDIILLAGQSNMSGRGTYDAGIDTTDASVFQYGGYSSEGTYRTIFAGSDPLTMPDKPSVGVGPGMFFAKRYKQLTGKKVLLVPCAQGGTSIVAGSVTWSPYGSFDTNLLNAITQTNLAVTAAVAAFPGSSVKGILWLQGEGDGANSVAEATYTTALYEVAKKLRATITGASSAWFVIGQMMPEAISFQGGTYSGIDSAHTTVGANTTGATKVAIGTGYNSGDNLHYNAAGARAMGTAMANAVSTAIANAGEAAPGVVTSLSAGTPGATSVTLTWVAPASGTTRNYEIQRSLAGANSWTTIVRIASTTASQAIGGLTASTAYDFRVRALNFGVGGSFTTITATTAAAVSGAFVRLTAITGSLISQSGSAGVGYTYTAASGATFAADHAGVSDLKLASGVSGTLDATIATPNTTKTPILGVVTSNTDPAYNAGASGYKFGIIAHSTGNYRVIVDGAGTAVVGNGTLTSVIAGDILRLERVSGSWTASIARTATPTSFTVIHTFAATHSGDAWAALSVAANGSVALGPLVGTGWA